MVYPATFTADTKCRSLKQSYLILHYINKYRMGGGGSKPEDIARMAAEDAPFNPPLGPPNPVCPPLVRWITIFAMYK